VGQGQDHPLLFRKALLVRNQEVHWIRPDLELHPGESREYMARIRYRQELKKARVIREAEGIYLLFDEPQRAVVPGQFAVWHYGDELIGSGPISD